MREITRRASVLSALLSIPACVPALRLPDGVPTPPPVEREFRGIWVASVSNIDWPSRPGLPAEQQRSELLAILDRARELGLNAVILQIRPAGDALYASELEPWSEYLTGAQGRPPEPLYDPLAFAVAEAHRRGLELHAWFNPYRARHPSARSPAAQTHITQAHPQLAPRYGTHLWMDPGEPAVQDHSIRVIMDVVRRYDVDGIHLDDYFYPYKERDAGGLLIDFPDSASYARYRAAGGRLGRDDWRRSNVDHFIDRLYREIKREKRWVKFGVSPIGTWRPGMRPQLGGFDAYREIYADALKWFTSGWLDYFVPQLYWPIARTDVSFPILLDWWAEQNLQRRHLWTGLGAHNVASAGPARWSPNEILGQIYVTRGHPGATGHVIFSMRTVMPDRDPFAGVRTDTMSLAQLDSLNLRRQIVRAQTDSLATLLRTHAYVRPALVPASPWLGGGTPARPTIRLTRNGSGATLTLEPGRPNEVFVWVVRARYRDTWKTDVLPGGTRTHALAVDSPAGGAPSLVVVSAVSRNGVEGPGAVAR